MIAISRPIAEIFQDQGASPFVFVCEHASNTIPDCLNCLGVDQTVRSSHVAWDIGALDVAKKLSSRLDAPLVACTVSRLAYDCNRPLDAIDCIPSFSENFEIPGNYYLSEADRKERFEDIHNPFHDAVNRTIMAQRERVESPITLVTIHSFTRVYYGEARNVELGFLHNGCERIAKAAFLREKSKGELFCALNEPYDASDGVTYTLEKHRHASGNGSVMVEIRNDLIDTPEGAYRIANRLADTLSFAIDATMNLREGI